LSRGKPYLRLQRLAIPCCSYDQGLTCGAMPGNASTPSAGFYSRHNKRSSVRFVTCTVAAFAWYAELVSSTLILQLRKKRHQATQPQSVGSLNRLWLLMGWALHQLSQTYHLASTSHVRWTLNKPCQAGSVRRYGPAHGLSLQYTACMHESRTMYVPTPVPMSMPPAR
jgi:hypothetical protein